MSIWSDRDINREVNKLGRVKVEPFDELGIQPASLDLRLGNAFWRFKRQGWLSKLIGTVDIIEVGKPVKPLMERFEADHTVLGPQEFLLGVTQERVSLGNDVIARVEGKSSLGRIGLSVHCTAGFIDPGNQDLAITMELFNQSPLPIRLSAGMWICQLAFQDTKNPCVVPYGPGRGSRYFGDKSAEPSRIAEKSGV
jgi:dCTP deaminase